MFTYLHPLTPLCVDSERAIWASFCFTFRVWIPRTYLRTLSTMFTYLYLRTLSTMFTTYI